MRPLNQWQLAANILPPGEIEQFAAQGHVFNGQTDTLKQRDALRPLAAKRRNISSMTAIARRTSSNRVTSDSFK